MRAMGLCRGVGMVAGVVLLVCDLAAAAPIVVTFTAEREDRVILTEPLEPEASIEPERLLVRLEYDSTATPTHLSLDEMDFQHYAMTGMSVSVIGGSGFVDYAVDGRPLTFDKRGREDTGMYVTNDFIVRPPAPELTSAESDPETQGLINIIGEVTLPLVGTQVADVFFTSQYNNLPESSAALVEDWLALLAGNNAEGRMLIVMAGTVEPPATREPVAEYRIDLDSVTVVPEPSVGAAAVMGLALLVRRRRASNH